MRISRGIWSSHTWYERVANNEEVWIKLEVHRHNGGKLGEAQAFVTCPVRLAAAETGKSSWPLPRTSATTTEAAAAGEPATTAEAATASSEGALP